MRGLKGMGDDRRQSQQSRLELGLGVGSGSRRAKVLYVKTGRNP